MAIAAGTFRGGRLVRDEPDAPDTPPAQPVKQADEPDASRKLQIVLSAAAGERTVQDVCDQHHIPQSTYYAWRAAIYHGATIALDEQTNGVMAVDV